VTREPARATRGHHRGDQREWGEQRRRARLREPPGPLRDPGRTRGGGRRPHRDGRHGESGQRAEQPAQAWPVRPSRLSSRCWGGRSIGPRSCSHRTSTGLSHRRSSAMTCRPTRCTSSCSPATAAPWLSSRSGLGPRRRSSRGIRCTAPPSPASSARWAPGRGEGGHRRTGRESLQDGLRRGSEDGGPCGLGDPVHAAPHLRAGVPVATAAALIGPDPAMYLRTYTRLYPGDLQSPAHASSQRDPTATRGLRGDGGSEWSATTANREPDQRVCAGRVPGPL
jgi:hypothetical protein